MIYWSLAFFILAIVAGLLGFTALAQSASTAGKILFFLFLILFAVGMVPRIIKRFRK